MAFISVHGSFVKCRLHWLLLSMTFTWATFFIAFHFGLAILHKNINAHMLFSQSIADTAEKNVEVSIEMKDNLCKLKRGTITLT